MIPIVEYMSVVSSYLPAFGGMFPEPQTKDFAGYIIDLMISSYRMVSVMNSLFYLFS